MNAVSEKTSAMRMRYSELYRNIETMAEKIMAPFILKWLISNSLDNNDPCMLRHTAGCSFYQGQCITNDLWVQNLRSTGI
jgi:hypothetical protein